MANKGIFYIIFNKEERSNNINPFLGRSDYHVFYCSVSRRAPRNGLHPFPCPDYL